MNFERIKASVNTAAMVQRTLAGETPNARDYYCTVHIRAMEQLTQNAIVQEFSVLYKQNHGGTFNGVLETLNKSLEDWVNQRIRAVIPNVILDFRTNMNTKIQFLRGEEMRFWVNDDNGPRHVYWMPPNEGHGGIFTREGGRFIQDAKDKRNEHTHEASQYPVLASFTAIKMEVGQGNEVGKYVLVFNPASANRFLRVDEAKTASIRDDHCLLLLRARRPDEVVDVELCEAHHRDLFLECLTKKEYEAEYDGELPPGMTHALVVAYGNDYFSVFFKRQTYSLLHAYFGYESGAKWKTHYFRFRLDALMSRLLV